MNTAAEAAARLGGGTADSYDDAPLTRADQIKLMSGAAERQTAVIKSWLRDPLIRSALRQTVSYDAPREPRAVWWGMTAVQIVTAAAFGLFFFDILRGLLLFVAMMGGGL